MSTIPISAPPASSTGKKRLFVVDDHPLLRMGLRSVIECEADFEISGEACSATQALDLLRKVPAEAALVDLSLPGTDGLELIKNIRAEHPHLPVLVLSAHDESQYAMRALRAGASGYLMKKDAADLLVPTLRKVLSGGIGVSQNFGDQLIFQVARGGAISAGENSGSPLDVLTDRELEILSAVGAGRSTQDIARSLNLSPKTVESHRLHIKEKLKMANSAEMVRFAMDWVTHRTETTDTKVERN